MVEFTFIGQLEMLSLCLQLFCAALDLKSMGMYMDQACPLHHSKILLSFVDKQSTLKD